MGSVRAKALGMWIVLVACGEAPADEELVTRHGELTVHSVVDSRLIASEVYRGDDLVALASADDEAVVVTWLGTGVEAEADKRGDDDPRDDLEAHHEEIASVCAGLEVVVPQEEFRNAPACGWLPFIGASANACIFSFCDDGCFALDCGPGPGGGGELHYIASSCGV
jgi:hypothetical protein